MQQPPAPCRPSPCKKPSPPQLIADAYASALAWDDATAPRALTILTAVLSVLVAVNEAACQAGRPEDQATIFHVRALLTDAAFRKGLPHNVEAGG